MIPYIDINYIRPSNAAAKLHIFRMVGHTTNIDTIIFGHRTKAANGHTRIISACYHYNRCI